MRSDGSQVVDTSSALCVDRVSVGYGRTAVLEDISLSIESGTTYALLGRNGAGKSSLIRCLLGQRPTTSGRFQVLGLDPWKQRARLMDSVGYVPETPQAPPRMTVDQLIAFSRGVRSTWSDRETRERLDRFEIPRSVPFGRLSRGQKTQVALVLALGSNPRILILDDPSLGLDAVARKQLFEELIRLMADHQPTVLLATHDFRGVERLAQTVGILSEGRLLVEGEIDALRHRFKRLMFPRSTDRRLLEKELEKLRPLSVETNSWGTEAVVSLSSAGGGHMLDGTPPATLSIEDIFVATTGGSGR